MSESQLLRKRLSPVSDSIGDYPNTPASEAETVEKLARELTEHLEHKALGVVKKTRTSI